MHTEKNSNPKKSTHLPELTEFLEPTASSINWIFHLTLTFAHEPKDEFAADKKLFLFLKEVAKAANRHPRELQYFTRIGRGDGGRLHCHVLLGDRHLNRIPKHALGQVGNSLQLAQFFKNQWTFGNAAAVPFQPIHLEYVTRASEGGFCDTSKAVRQAVKKAKKTPHTEIL